MVENICRIGILVIIAVVSSQGWVWHCDGPTGFCTRLAEKEALDYVYPTLESCRLICGTYGSLWPRPTTTPVLGHELVPFVTANFIYSIEEPGKGFLDSVVQYFKEQLSINKALNCRTNNYLTISLEAKSNNTDLKWETDESYSIDGQVQGETISISIFGITVFGVRHGLETLLQLITSLPIRTDETCRATLNKIDIHDKPVYKHRGLLLDTARNFLSVETIKKSIDGMAASKMNVLHWHATDSQSFPLELPRLPNMTLYGAYSKDQVYTPNDVLDLTEYAKVRGVRIILEIDAPSHAGNGWQWGPEAGFGNLAVCLNEQPWRSYCIQPPCGQMNPVNSKLYDVLQELYSDVSDLFPNSEVFHMGGDEVFIPCWNATPEIYNSLGDKPRNDETYLELWSNYQAKALKAYDAAVENSKTSVIVWSSHLTEPENISKYLSKDRYIVQTWIPAANESIQEDLLRLGYRLIISTKDKWYLDHGFWGTTVYHNWRVVYENRILLRDGVLGGEGDAYIVRNKCLGFSVCRGINLFLSNVTVIVKYFKPIQNCIKLQCTKHVDFWWDVYGWNYLTMTAALKKTVVMCGYDRSHIMLAPTYYTHVIRCHKAAWQREMKPSIKVVGVNQNEEKNWSMLATTQKPKPSWYELIPPPAAPNPTEESWD